MLESKFQKQLIDKIKERTGAFVLKTNPNYIQGVPDLLVLHKNKWAAIECKNSMHAQKQPNQEYYINMFNEWSCAIFAFPENEEEVLGILERYFNAVD